MGVDLTATGFTAQFAPVMKRATATMSDGSMVMIIPDTNAAAGHGSDTTGVAKVRLYKSDNSDNPSWSFSGTWTPSVVFASGTVAAVMAMAIDSSNNLYIAWAGTNNSLNFVNLPWGGTAWSVGTTQQIVASNAVARRYRVIDIDLINNTEPVVAVYEAQSSTSAWARLYVRNDDGTTWINAFTDDFSTLAGGSLAIMAGSEDISVCAGSISSNVAQIVLGYTRMTSTIDYGDLVQQLSYNVHTGTAASATQVGQWPIFNMGVGAPYRKLWLDYVSSTVWQFSSAVGSSNPQFQVARLTAGTFVGLSADVIQSTGPNGSNGNMSMDTSVNPYNYVACTYINNSVIFGYLYLGVPSYVSGAFGAVFAASVLSYKDATSLTTSRKDSIARPGDNYYVLSGNRPVGIYGAMHHSNGFPANFFGLIGVPGNSLTTPIVAHGIYETAYDAPTAGSPTSTQNNNTPLIQSVVQSPLKYPTGLGKIEWNIASDAGFTINVNDIIQADSAYRYMGSKSSANPPVQTFIQQLNGIAPQVLFTGTWFARSRVISDMATFPSPWSPTYSFIVIHPPTTIGVSPGQGQYVDWGLGLVILSWVYSDTEPTAPQSAYQVKVDRLDTGSNVYDSGKVFSSVSTHNFGSTAAPLPKDVLLQWSVAAWDTSDTKGPFSTPIQFTLTDGPVTTLIDPVDGAGAPSPAPSMSWTSTFGTNKFQKAFRAHWNTIDALDYFARNTSNGLGTSTSGSVWTVKTGLASYYSTSSSTNRATIVAGVDNVNIHVVNDTALTDTTVMCDVRCNQTVTGDVVVASVFSRYVSESQRYEATVQFKPSGKFDIGLYCATASGTSIQVALFVDAASYAINTDYTVMFEAVNNRLRMKVWLASAGEPSAWDLSAYLTDPSSIIQTPGSGGLSVYSGPANTNTNPSVSFSNYQQWSYVGNIIGDSGWLTGSNMAYQFLANILPTTGVYYMAVVEVQDNRGIIGSAHSVVLGSWTPPPQANFTVTPSKEGVMVNWDNSTKATTFRSWRVWRRYNTAAADYLDANNSRNTWVMISELYDGSSNTFQLTDYLAPMAKSIDYAVTQSIQVGNSVIDSGLTTFVTTTLPSNRYFFVPLEVIGGINTYEAFNVTVDGFTEDLEEQVVQIVNRGRQVQIGDDLGTSGSMTIQLRSVSNARADREFFQYLARNSLPVYMKTPFGDIFLIKFSPIPVARMAGVGQSDMSDLTLGYTEVVDEQQPITRTS